MRKNGFWLILVLLAAASGLAYWTLAQRPAPQTASAPQSLGQIAGEAAALDLSRYTGRVVVVNFMAGWCPSCWAEIPGFLEVYHDLKDRGLVLVGIALQTPVEDTRRMIQRLGITYPVYLDEDGRASIERFGLRSMPTTLIFDQTGRLVQHLAGEVPADVLRRILEELL